jgi:hypothetical protein
MLVVHDEAAQLAAQEAPKWCAKLAVLVESVWVKKYTKINIEKMKSGKS